MSAITGNMTQPNAFVDTSKSSPAGLTAIMLDVDIDADYQSEANDRLNICTIPEGWTIAYLDIHDNEAGDSHATPTLDADIVLVQGVASPSDTGTETVLYNAGTRWQSASTTIVRTWVNTKLTEKGYNGKAYLRWKCVAASATAVDNFNIRMTAWVQPH